ncbi:MAG: hypothetical protein WA151_11395 [Desulfatirhabdiaceae bacterium]
MEWFTWDKIVLLASILSVVGATAMPILISLFPDSRWLKAIYGIGRIVLPYLTRKKGIGKQ